MEGSKKKHIELFFSFFASMWKWLDVHGVPVYVRAFQGVSSELSWLLWRRAWSRCEQISDGMRVGCLNMKPQARRSKAHISLLRGKVIAGHFSNESSPATSFRSFHFYSHSHEKQTFFSPFVFILFILSRFRFRAVFVFSVRLFVSRSVIQPEWVKRVKHSDWNSLEKYVSKPHLFGSAIMEKQPERNEIRSTLPQRRRIHLMGWLNENEKELLLSWSAVCSVLGMEWNGRSGVTSEETFTIYESLWALWRCERKRAVLELFDGKLSCDVNVAQAIWRCSLA